MINSTVKEIVINKGKAPFQGLSAYQLAIRNGFVGTEQEWLMNLRGDTGGLNAVAGETLSGGRVVVIKEDGKIYKYDVNDIEHYGLACGITKTAALIGNQVQVFTNGIATEIGSGWIAGKEYFVGLDGQVTTNPNQGRIVKKIGVGVAVDKILLTGGIELLTT